MKRMLLLTLLIFGLTTAGYAQMGSKGMMTGVEKPATAKQQEPYQMGPGMMGYGMGPGMMGYGMGPGMMGYGMGPGMMGYGMGPGMMGGYVTGRGYSKAYQKFFDETKDLRKDLNGKMFDYFEALRNPQTKPETITKLRKEILDLNNKIYEKAPKTGLGRYGERGCGW